MFVKFLGGQDYGSKLPSEYDLQHFKPKYKIQKTERLSKSEELRNGNDRARHLNSKAPLILPFITEKYCVNNASTNDAASLPGVPLRRFRIGVIRRRTWQRQMSLDN
ncbi:hypothetical protein KIN20_028919 [Parelaphostrongylus tenuis]|uniref:Uncharacterized protein n=1 Tax=Parelaphostrongylus tenuis TaxID=148309 RepID=A0AAD5WF65_PARTN|nr:hypothetical protein KIN20_028919 [Parelaphostrongylus tenuis]